MYNEVCLAVEGQLLSDATGRNALYKLHVGLGKIVNALDTAAEAGVPAAAVKYRRSMSRASSVGYESAAASHRSGSVAVEDKPGSRGGGAASRDEGGVIKEEDEEDDDATVVLSKTQAVGSARDANAGKGDDESLVDDLLSEEDQEMVDVGQEEEEQEEDEEDEDDIL